MSKEQIEYLRGELIKTYADMPLSGRAAYLKIFFVGDGHGRKPLIRVFKFVELDFETLTEGTNPCVTD